MKIITQPTVRLIGHTGVCSRDIENWLIERNVWDQVFDVPEDLIEFAGKLCYMSFGKGRKGQKYLDHILESGHGSVLEHVSASFLIEGVSRTLTHELVRHRAGFAYSQLSQRYVDESDVAFVQPPELKPESPGYLSWHTACDFALRSYRTLIEKLEATRPEDVPGTDRRKRVRQAARSVLPGCTETKIVVTANLRAWRHFLEQRGSEFADLEIRRLAGHVLVALLKYGPGVFADFTEEPHPSGVPVLRNRWRKV